MTKATFSNETNTATNAQSQSASSKKEALRQHQPHQLWRCHKMNTSTLLADYNALPLSDLEALAEIYALADDPDTERRSVINEVIKGKTEAARWKRFSRQHEQHSRDNREAAKSYAVFLDDLEQVDANRGAIFKYLRGYLIPAQQLATVNLLDFIDAGRVDYQALDDFLHRHAIEVGE